MQSNHIQTLRIYYSGNQYPTYYEDVPCFRWDEDNWSVTVEFGCTSSQRDTIFSYIVPGAVTEQYNVLGTPYFKDLTYESGNTLIFEPISGYGLSSVRWKRTVAVQNASDTFLNYEYFLVKLETKRLDT